MQFECNVMAKNCDKSKQTFGVNNTIDMLTSRFCQPSNCFRCEEHNNV